MSPREHLEKAQRIAAGLDKLDASDDALAIIDGTMIAGYHLGNALLHLHGATAPSLHFNTPSKLTMPLESLPAAVRPAYEAFERLEALRTRYVRNPEAADAQVVSDAKHRLEAMMRHCGLGRCG